MSQEIELKLTANQEVINSLKQELSHFQLLTQKQVFSQNSYFDTEDHFFAKKKMGLRVRKEQDRYTMTLKTTGSTQGALHIRPEYNVQLSSSTPDMTQFAQYAELQLERDYQTLQSTLQPIFSTDFQREYYLLETGNGTQLEIAIDQGKILAKQQQAPISEIEIELKNGKVIDVLNFVQNLLFLDGMRLGQESKAERGYQLAGLGKAAQKVTLNDWLQLLQQHYVSAQGQILALYQYELRLLKFLEQTDRSKLISNAEATTTMLDLFSKLYQYYVEKTVLLQQAASTLEQQQLAVAEIIDDVYEGNQVVYQQLRQIIARHLEHQDHAKAIQQLFDLTAQGQYLQRMINLLKFTLK